MTLGRVLSLALLIRVALLTAVWLPAGDTRVFLAPDSPQYLGPATRLAKEGRYWNERGPEIFRPPGFAVVLLPGLWIGQAAVGGVALQLMLGLGATALVFAIGGHLGGRAVAAAAGVWFAIEPLQWVLGARLLSETACTFCVAAALAFALDWLRTARRLSLLGAALAAAAASYVRPIAYLLGPALVLMALALAPDAHRTERRRHAVLALLLWATCLSAWHVRNGLATGYWGFSTQLDRVIAFWIPAGVESARGERSYTEARAELRAREQRPGFETPDNLARLRREGLKALADGPVEYAGVYFRGMARTLLNPGALGLLGLFGTPEAHMDGLGRQVTDQGIVRTLGGVLVSRPLVVLTFAALGLYLLAQLCLASLGLWRGDRETRGARLLTAAVAVYFLLLSGGPSGESRFRHPMTPSLCALAGAGVAALRSRRA